MDKQEFISEFEKAKKCCKKIAQEYVIECLPEPTLFNLLHGFLTPDKSGFIKFLGGRLLKTREYFELDLHKVVKFLWVNGKVPFWINLNVGYIENGYTFIEVVVSKRLIEYENTMYSGDNGKHPFHILSPPLPLGWKPMEENGKFNLKKNKRYKILT